MKILPNLNVKTKTIALIAIFSALYAALRLVPTVPMIGAQGAAFSLSDVLAPLYGILLGPFTGGFSVIIGTFVAIAMGKPVVFMGLDFLPALVNTVAIGFLVRRKWWPVVALNAVLIFAYVLNPLTLNIVNTPIGPFPFVWVHIIAFVVLVSPLGRKAGQWLEASKSVKITVSFAALAFVGTMMQHLTGGILTEVVRGQILGLFTPDFFHTIMWPAVFYVYPWERLGLIILATVIGVPVYRIIKKSFFSEGKNPNPK